MDGELRAFQQLIRTRGPELDLARAALAVARVEHPDLDEEAVLCRLDDLAARSRVGTGRGAGGARAALDRLVDFLFVEQGFRGNVDQYYDARNSCLNDVLDRRLGIPITLSVLAIEVGRRVGLALAGLGLPGHFIVSAAIGRRQILLDPFHGGAVLTPDGAAAVAARALGRPVRLEDAHWVPCTPRQIVVRMLRNLKTAYVRGGDWDRCLATIDRLRVAEPESPAHLRDRGTTLVKLGRLWEGAAEWENYLTTYPGVQDAQNLRSELRRIRQRLASCN